MAEKTGSRVSTNSGSTPSTTKSSSGSNRSTGNTSSNSAGMNSSNESLKSSPGVSHSSETNASDTSGSSRPEGVEGVLGLLQKLGMDEQHWRTYVSDTVNTKIQDLDYRDVMDRAKEYASMSGDKLKELSTKNPKMFYSGLAAFILGAGMMANAARTSSSSASLDSTEDESRPVVR